MGKSMGHLNSFVTIRKLETMQSVCNTFRAIGIENFHHDITFKGGEISMLTTNPEIFKTYHRNRTPSICTNESGRTLESGIYLDTHLMDNYQDCSTIIPEFVSKFNPDSKRLIFIIEKEAEYQHAYTLFPGFRGGDYIHWLINNLPTIKKSIDQYKISAKNIIFEAQQPENRFTLPFYPSNLNPSTNLTSIEKGTSLFNNETKTSGPAIVHKRTGKILTLAPQQTRCLASLLLGMSSKEIAISMGLSNRSVEHYIQRIRKILGLKSSKELLAEFTLSF